MPSVYTDRDHYNLGDEVLVHYSGFPSNTTLGIAWITEDGKIYNYPHVGSFNSGNGSGVVEITTSQGGKQLSPGRYRIKVWVWDNPNVYAETGTIYVGTGYTPPSPQPQPYPTPYQPTPPQPSGIPMMPMIALAVGIPLIAGVMYFIMHRR